MQLPARNGRRDAEVDLLPALQIEDLHVSFGGHGGRTHAVNGVSFTIGRGEVFSIVGESGCGKSVTALAVVNLLSRPAGRVDRGQIRLGTRQGAVDVTGLDPVGAAMRALRGREVAMIFQEPMRSLHPMYSVGDQIVEAIRQHFPVSRKEALDRALTLLARVGMPQPLRVARSYPHQLSGGMRQRAMIAIALACEPQLLIADEPTTALDVTIQAQILDLIRQIRDETRMAVLLITHDMGVVAEMADRVAVMYLGQVVELATVEEIFARPQHPYTQGLLAAIPSLVSRPKTPLRSMPGTVPELNQPPQGCVFATRCPHVHERCRHEPPVVSTGQGHAVKCWLHVPDQAASHAEEGFARHA